jgi:exopolysaccharide biosynthesis polyprenyl glycosylphosphotransferase
MRTRENMAHRVWATDAHTRSGHLNNVTDWPAGHSGASALRLRPARAARRRRPSRLLYLLEGPGWTSVRVLSDLVTAISAVLIAVATTNVPVASIGVDHPALFAFPLVVVCMLQLRGLYRRRMHITILDGLGPVAGAVSIGAMSVLTWEVLVQHDAAAGALLGRTWGLTVVLLGGARLLLAVLQRRARAMQWIGRPTLIVGAGEVASQVARRLEEHPEYGLRPAGFLDADPLATLDAGPRSLPVLGSPEDLAWIAEQTGAQHVILAFSNAPDRSLVRLTRECEELGLEVSLVPRLFESINDRFALERLGGMPLLGLRAIDPKGWQFNVKYALDKPLAAMMLLVAAPVMLAAFVAVKLTSPGPVLFRQRRLGLDGKPFYLLKFRSMNVAPDDGFAPAYGAAPGGVEGDDRRTRLGRILRRFAVDELPQFWNVLKGEMSIIGPRPERPQYVERFDRDHDRYGDRHRVRAGITGWAQVHGLRGQTSLADRIEWDNFYIENWSLWLDLKVLLMTLGAVLRSGDDA